MLLDVLFERCNDMAEFVIGYINCTVLVMSLISPGETFLIKPIIRCDVNNHNYY